MPQASAVTEIRMRMPMILKNPRAGKTQRRAALVIDDQEMVRVVASGMLEKAGFRALTAEDGAEGLRRLRADPGRIELVLLDLILPDRHGLEILAELRGLQPDLPVILCNGYTEQAIDLRRFLQRRTTFIQKPFGYQALIQKMEDVGIVPDPPDPD